MITFELQEKNSTKRKKIDLSYKKKKQCQKQNKQTTKQKIRQIERKERNLKKALIKKNRIFLPKKEDQSGLNFSTELKHFLGSSRASQHGASEFSQRTESRKLHWCFLEIIFLNKPKRICKKAPNTKNKKKVKGLRTFWTQSNYFLSKKTDSASFLASQSKPILKRIRLFNPSLPFLTRKHRKAKSSFEDPYVYVSEERERDIKCRQSHPRRYVNNERDQYR